jgi:hypothetical protein
MRILARRHAEHDAADASEAQRATREAELRWARVRAARGHSRWQELDPVDLVKRGHLWVSAQTDDCYALHPGATFQPGTANLVADMTPLYFVADDDDELTILERQPPQWSARVQLQAERDARRARAR